MRVEFHPLTPSDLSDAASHYDALQPGLSKALREEIHASITRILENPKQFPEIERGIRRCLVHRFPYSVLFRIISDETIRILLIRHHRRHQRFGANRR